MTRVFDEEGFDEEGLNENRESRAELAVDQALTVTLPISVVVGDEVLLRNLVEDLALKIFTPEEIGARYSIDPREIVKLIRDNAEVRKRVQIRRAIWQSNESLDTRIRHYAGTTLLEALPSTGERLFNPETPPNLQLDYLKAYSRMAGVDGLPASAKNGENATGNQQFVVNFHFSGGRVERISTTTDPLRSETEPDLPLTIENE